MTYVVGQKVVITRAPERRGSEYTISEGTVTKVGTKWTHVMCGEWRNVRRFDREGHEDSEWCPARLWPTIEAFEEDRKRAQLWAVLCQERFWGEPPAALATSDIVAFVEALKKAKEA